MMLAFGHPLVTVSAWLGHTRTSTTERAYLNQIESMHDQAGDRMRAQMDAGRTVNATVNTEGFGLDGAPGIVRERAGPHGNAD